MQRTMCHYANLFGILKSRVVQFSSVLLMTQAVFSAEDAVKLPLKESVGGTQVVEKNQGSQLGNGTLPKKPLTPPPYTHSLEISNEFDRQRRLWPDRVPPAPPPPPPPPPTPLTEQDIQLYGVVIVGQIKRATVKFGPRFSSLNTTGKQFTTISEGQAIGEYRLTGINPTHLVLTAPGGQQQLSFNKKTDRTAGISQSAPTITGSNDIDANAVAGQQQATAADASSKLPSSGAAVNVASTPAVSTENVLKNPAPGSLAAAIVAAQAAAAQNPAPQAQNAPPPANFNPFLQLLPKQ